MAKEKDELGIMEDFEWALSDPNEVRIRQLGEVVSTITTKLVDAIGELQEIVNSVNAKISEIDGRIAQLESNYARLAQGAPAGVSSAPTPSPAAAGEPIARAPSPAPAASPGGPTSLMGELKSLLAARRRKSEGSES
ncbi:MAG: hypothetical protein JSW61_14790 [Candidatus Thorarchaeota archaeon]|nr:MAG: hypothetical protein JSW61_14790 [Candidatus Thorarchaeota archaeon]